MVKVMIGFVVGVAVGAAAALMLAPSSGEELRQQMHDSADADMQRMRSDYHRGMDDLHTRMDKMSTDFTAAVHKDKGQEEVVDVEVDVEIDAA